MKICFLSGLKEIVDREELEIEFAGKVSELMEALCTRFGNRFRERVMASDSSRTRNPFAKILVDGEDIRSEDPVLTGQETLFIFLPIAGG